MAESNTEVRSGEAQVAFARLGGQALARVAAGVVHQRLQVVSTLQAVVGPSSPARDARVHLPPVALCEPGSQRIASIRVRTSAGGGGWL